MVSKVIRLKLFVKKKSHKLLFAVAGKDFVDFLLSLLTLPVGSVVKHVQKDFMVGCIGNLYESIENLRDEYIQIGKKKNMLLNPTPPFVPFGPNSPRLLKKNAKGDSMEFYTCNGHNHRYFTDFSGVPCPQCKRAMTTECIYVAKDGASSSSVGGGGFVKDVVTYSVMDDLVVNPMSPTSTIDLLRQRGIKKLTDVEVREVEVAAAEGLAILKASLKSKTVLTDTFLSCGKKKA